MACPVHGVLVGFGTPYVFIRSESSWDLAIVVIMRIWDIGQSLKAGQAPAGPLAHVPSLRDLDVVEVSWCTTCCGGCVCM